MDFLGGFLGKCVLAGDSDGDDSKDRRTEDTRTKDLNSNVGSARTKDDQLDFYLYDDNTNKDAYKPLIPFDEESLRQANFDPSKVTKVLIHTRMSSFLSEFPQNVKDAYLDNPFNSNYNVICVDWSELAQAMSVVYDDVLPRLSVIGQRVGSFLHWLGTVTNLDLMNDTHIVGHGVGAHAAGEAGALMKAQRRGLGRISGLDPCKAGYYGLNPDSRCLYRHDAAFVDVYHTDVRCLGTPDRLGDLDFYINEGDNQPFFGNEFREDHHAAHRYFAQTIVRGPDRTELPLPLDVRVGHDHGGYIGRIIYGEYALHESRGSYYVRHNLIEEED